MITALLVIVVVGSLPGLSDLIVYDNSHHTTMECTVINADAENSIASTNSASTAPEILIDTKDCGLYSPQWGLSADNLQQAAAQLHPGYSYEFQLGEGSKLYLRLLHLLRITPTVYGFSPVTS